MNAYINTHNVEVIAYVLLLLSLGFILGLTIAHRKQVNFLDLIVGSDGKLSHSKFWSNIALAMGTWAFVYMVIAETMTEFLWITYLGVYTGNKLLNTIVQSKYSQQLGTAKEQKEESKDDRND